MTPPRDRDDTIVELVMGMILLAGVLLGFFIPFLHLHAQHVRQTASDVRVTGVLLTDPTPYDHGDAGAVAPVRVTMPDGRTRTVRADLDIHHAQGDHIHLWVTRAGTYTTAPTSTGQVIAGTLFGVFIGGAFGLALACGTANELQSALITRRERSPIRDIAPTR